MYFSFMKIKKLSLLLLSFFVLSNSVIAQRHATTEQGKKVILFDNGTWKYLDSNSNAIINNLEIPAMDKHTVFIQHFSYTLDYNEKTEQANWVAYQLSKEHTNALFERTNRFIIDPKVITGSATSEDYEKSGYDRGHLAPAGDMAWSETAMKESFYYSNMSPQVPSFNRGIWKKLEGLMRSWAVENERIYIVTGPVFSTDTFLTIGPNKVVVPTSYYKVILDYSQPEIKGIGFVIPNKKSSQPLQQFATSIDSVEKITEIDFFPLLKNNVEKAIEKTKNIDLWTWKINYNTQQKSVKDAPSYQCKGKTKLGERCKNRTYNKTGFCYLHEKQFKN